MNIADLRRDYARQGLDEQQLDAHPLKQFAIWFKEVHDAGVLEPNAMTLATVDASGSPSARIVLLKGIEDRGITFFTNYDSRKGRELADNPHAAVVIYWAEVERQVRIEGTVEKTSREESEYYFHSRPYGSQLGAWVSQQSQPVASRQVLEQRMEELKRQHPEGHVPLPPFWGGYRLLPTSIEFWQGRPSRLHDRLHYLQRDGRWVVERLSP